MNSKSLPFRWLITCAMGVAFSAVILGGCAALPTPNDFPTREVTMPPPATSIREVTMTPPAAPTRPASDLAPETQAALDLARRLNLKADQVELISAGKTEMPADTLGCGPDQGVTKPASIIGDEIVLRAGGREYVYRGNGRWLTPCQPTDFPGGRAPLAMAASNTPDALARNAAINDLAQRLGLARDAVTVVQVEAVEWNDASLGCAKPGMMYAQVITPGFRIVLAAAGISYEYHTGSGANVMACGTSAGASGKNTQ